MTSAYAIGEVRRNIRSPHQGLRFGDILSRTEMVVDGDLDLLSSNIQLVAKDRQILATAIAASAGYLITGDRNHFSHLYGRRVEGVQVVLPAIFLDLHRERL